MLLQSFLYCSPGVQALGVCVSICLSVCVMYMHLLVYLYDLNVYKECNCLILSCNKSSYPSIYIQGDAKEKETHPLSTFPPSPGGRGPSPDTVISCRTLLQGMDVRWQPGDCTLQPRGPCLQEAAPLQLSRGQCPHLYQVGPNGKHPGGNMWFPHCRHPQLVSHRLCAFGLPTCPN